MSPVRGPLSAEWQGRAGEEAEERLVAVASRRGARQGVPCIICEEAEKWLDVSRGVLLISEDSAHVGAIDLALEPLVG